MNELFICGKYGDCFIQISHCFEFYVTEKNSIRAVPDSGSSITLGEYSSYELACVVLNDLLTHAPIGGIYRMPDDERAQLLLRSSRPISPGKFASNGKKPVRRGGS